VVHHHDKRADGGGRRLLLVTVLNILITVAEIIGGIMANSLALLSDAIHNFSDTIAILLAYIARRVSGRASNERKTFGYKRIEILAAFFNALVLIGISAFLVLEAIKRFQDPEPIKGLLMFIVATAGLLFNLFAVILLRKHSGSNLNIRSAYLHLIGDTLSSFVVIVGGILIYFSGVYWIDPLVTILISIYIIKEAWDIVKESADILMQATPKGIDIPAIRKELEGIAGISNIHHVHVWALNDQEYHFECHADLEADQPVSATTIIREKIEHILKEHHGIGHMTVQFEYDTCDDKAVIHNGHR
jgi:cobalt-zinc-cadmium efflux system protein